MLKLLFVIILFGNFMTTTFAGQFELKVINYNIKGLPLPWMVHDKRYKHIGNSLNLHFKAEGVPHILTLQEAFHKKTALVGDALGFPNRVKGPKGKGVRINAGLETLSSFNVVAIHQHIFKGCISWDCLSRKGVLHTRLSHPDLPFMIDLYNTHMQAGPSSDPVTPESWTVKVREKQAMQMIDFVKATHDPDNMLLMIGDFNFRPDSKIYPIFTNALEVDNAARICTFVEPCAGTTDPFSIWESLIDHQFFRLPANNTATARPVYFNQILHDPTGGKKLSDHEAVVVTYLIEW